MGIAETAVAHAPVNRAFRATDQDRQAFMDALADLDRALETNLERTRRMKRRIADLQQACASGRPIREIIPDEESPLLVQLLTESTGSLDAHGSRVRRTEARLLHREGVPMEEIARLFGVTRQRVSALLRGGSR
jgi:DNA-directed RNA polymerase sigma subunit (sigma70/sigma32)